MPGFPISDGVSGALAERSAIRSGTLPSELHKPAPADAEAGTGFLRPSGRKRCFGIGACREPQCAADSPTSAALCRLRSRSGGDPGSRVWSAGAAQVGPGPRLLACGRTFSEGQPFPLCQSRVLRGTALRQRNTRPATPPVRLYGMLVSGRSPAASEHIPGDDPVRAKKASQGNTHKAVLRGSAHTGKLGPGLPADQYWDATA